MLSDNRDLCCEEMPKAVSKLARFSVTSAQLKAAMAEISQMENIHGKHLTMFQRQVLAACYLVPKGTVTTYGSIGSVIARCNKESEVNLSLRARAVGQALRRNPFAPVVPCHRVVAANFKLHGFSGETDGATMGKKVSLLKAEGVSITNLLKEGTFSGAYLQVDRASVLA